MIFKIFGIRFEISYLFTAALAIFIAADKTGNILIFLLAAMAHEVGHLLCMVILNAKPDEIVLNPGTIRIVKNSITTNNETLLILLSGPVINLMIFLICINFQAVKLFAVINLVLFIFNLLPIEGLDGGSILKLALKLKHSEKYAEKVLFIITLFFASGLIFAFIYLVMNGRVNYSLPILFLYLILPYVIKKTC